MHWMMRSSSLSWRYGCMGSKARFNRFLKQLGYAYREETDNPVYNLFLR